MKRFAPLAGFMCRRPARRLRGLSGRHADVRQRLRRCSGYDGYDGYAAGAAVVPQTNVYMGYSNYSGPGYYGGPGRYYGPGPGSRGYPGSGSAEQWQLRKPRQPRRQQWPPRASRTADRRRQGAVGGPAADRAGRTGRRPGAGGPPPRRHSRPVMVVDEAMVAAMAAAMAVSKASSGGSGHQSDGRSASIEST